MFTSEDFQKLMRIAIYVGSSALSVYFVQNDAMVQAMFTVGAVVANFLWSLYGMRLNTKLAEVAKIAADPRTPLKPIQVENTIEGRKIAEAVPEVIVVEPLRGT